MSRRPSSEPISKPSSSKRPRMEEPSAKEPSAKEPSTKERLYPRNDYIQILVVGNAQCGKTTLVRSYLNKMLPSEAVNILSQPYLHNHATGRELMIWDLDAKGQFIDCRIEAYGKADIVLLCYNPIREKKPSETQDATSQRESFVNTVARWKHEIRRYRHGVPVILVRLIRTMELGRCAPDDEYTEEEAGQLYTDPEWSILTLTSRVEVLSRPSLDELFNKAVDIVLDRGVTPKETNFYGFLFE
ncbi:hypothetical protein CEXT_525001 [Caerostris extrusa]|uniref:P-loop containing nucleoside triphosphate hydrolase protein n=1 Tax=Caerostris extrusa TaxID=172846 RepID=A0AAV4RA12_CAEEX|nr:hypothetical protein CEXT_525001 [Caerostris extrusa]